MRFLVFVFAAIFALSVGVCIDGGMPKENVFKVMVKRFTYSFSCLTILIFSGLIQILGLISLAKLLFAI